MRHGSAKKRLGGVLSLDDFETAARRHLPRPIFGYVAGAVETDWSLHDNRAAFAEFGLLPRMLVDVSKRSQQTTLFGKTYAAPFGISPLGISALYAYRGDIVLATAAEAANIPMIMSSSSLIRLEDVATESKSAWFQAYLPGDVPDITALIDRVAREASLQLGALPRREIAGAALEAHGALVLTRSLEEAVEVANLLAPEHLELQVEDPEALLSLVRNAGAVFLGRLTPEVVGDYVAGPNHVLPTGGTARFASALGTEDFVKRMSVIQYAEAGLRDAAPHLAELARVEGLDGHGAAATVRIERTGGTT